MLIIVAILVLMVLVTIHEFGHYIAAKACGVPVLEFAVGMGPAILKKQGKETLYSLRILPIGGYCKLEGEDTPSDDANEFGSKAPWKRLIVLAAGSIMNIITGFIIISIIYSSIQEIAIPVVDTFLENSPAQAAGLEVGDRIISVNGNSVNTFIDLNFELSRTKGNECTVVYKRDGIKLSANIIPMPYEERYLLGFNSARELLTPLSSIKYAYYEVVSIGKSMFKLPVYMIEGMVTKDDISGPVGIVNTIGDAAKAENKMSLLGLAAFISVNLGFFNIFPFPALDGGRIIFVFVEMVRRKKISAEKEGIVHFIGFALLILLVIFTTTNDIMKIVGS